MAKSPCPECPWVLNDEKSIQWREYIRGKVECDTVHLENVKTIIHRCHMKDLNPFDEKDKNIYSNPKTNLCIGSCNQHAKDIHSRRNQKVHPEQR